MLRSKKKKKKNHFQNSLTENFRDETRLTFLQEVFDSAFSLYGKRNQPKGSRNAGGRGSPEGSVGGSEERLQAVGNQPADSDVSPTAATGASRNKVCSVNIVNVEIQL